MTHAEANRTAELLAALPALTGRPCAGCARPICGHEAVISVALGFKNAPRCLPCVAVALGADPAELRDHVVQHIRRRDCYVQGWLWSSQREGSGATVHPQCLWPNGDGAAEWEEYAAMKNLPSDTEAADAEWDAGEMGCGELVLELRLRLNAMPPGSILKLTARDLGAPADLPAWCGMTGHTLLEARHPEYWIKRKEH